MQILLRKYLTEVKYLLENTNQSLFGPCYGIDIHFLTFEANDDIEENVRLFSLGTLAEQEAENLER